MQKSSEDLTMAHEYYREQDYKNCLKVYDILFHKGEQLSISELKEYAISLQKNMRYFESIEIARKILDKKRVDIDIFLNMCICLGKIGKYPDALEYYNKILKINKNYNIQIGYYAYLLGQVGKNEIADFYYKIAIDIEPDNAWYISHYAFFLQKIKEYSRSEYYYKIALNKDKNNSWLSKRYAYFLKELKGKEKAYSYYEQLFCENPYNYNYYINAAELAFISNDIEESLRYLEKANSINKPKVMEIILRFYWAIYYILSDDLKEFEKETLALKSLRRQYTGFIHRDLTDLSFYISNNLNEIKKQKYEYISSILYKGE